MAASSKGICRADKDFMELLWLDRAVLAQLGTHSRPASIGHTSGQSAAWLPDALIMVVLNLTLIFQEVFFLV